MTAPKDVFNEIIERLNEIEKQDPGLKKTIEKAIADFAKGEGQPDPIKTKKSKPKKSGPKRSI